MTAINEAPIRDRKSINSVSSADRHRAVSTLVTAFSTDPVVRWLYPEPAQYLQHFPGFVELFAGKAFDHGTAFSTDNYAAAALWLEPGVEFDGEALVDHLRRTVSEHHWESVLALFEEVEGYFPKEPLWYLPLIGVDPRHQGRGHGSALLRQALEKCDEQHMPAYLESSSERNIPLYERHGFEVLAKVQVDGSPPAWPMYRNAR